ncbi:sigma-70 family RNA polymerase sigma factor [Solirubrobacter phytolaccae]|uniref:Sigma-70 family RNA polymerase sigma factor n=1 Tax=Solirubrobacter phytolaccae TaxID=1404360 RepID=A0A9X3N7D8_9ACTN|nr:sigma-70 family RNA polymerase sigma factor [Solirubrobacter phytolaccae]MDA0180856.1 sigma-70 family RNA polymerase sigma factor [Solirubrobacter phytolaccae]
MDTEDPRTDEALLAATASDPEAFAVFYRRHLRAVLAFLVHRTGRPDLASDLAAETFAGALQSLSRFEPTGSARGWLFAIASNKLSDSARRGAVVDRSRRALGMPVRAVTDPELERAEELIDAQRMAGDLDALLAELPDEQRAALQARIVEERDYRELAAEWNCSEAVVRQRVARGLSALRRRLGVVA